MYVLYLKEVRRMCLSLFNAHTGLQCGYYVVFLQAKRKILNSNDKAATVSAYFQAVMLPLLLVEPSTSTRSLV